MRPWHLALALLIAAVWGFNFIAIKLSVSEAPPFFVTALRFMLAAFPAILLVPRPKESWGWVFGFGLVLGVGQFGFLFLAVRLGLPAGLTSLVMQSQAPFTLLFAWLVLSEVPLTRQLWGGAVSLSGIGVIAYSRWHGSEFLPLILCVLAAAGWAAANIVSKVAKPQNTLSFVVWSSLAVPLPMMAMSIVFEDHAQIISVIANPSWTLIASLCYLAFLSTIFGYAAWNYLFNVYSASTVAPFSMLVPLFGVLGGMVAFGERLDQFEIIGAVFIIGGLLVANFEWRKMLFKKKMARPEGPAE